MSPTSHWQGQLFQEWWESELIANILIVGQKGSMTVPFHIFYIRYWILAKIGAEERESSENEI